MTEKDSYRRLYVATDKLLSYFNGYMYDACELLQISYIVFATNLQACDLFIG